MAQLFPPSVDLYAKFLALGVGLLLVGGTYSFYLLNRSPYWTNVGVTLQQPVPFSHKHHAGELGLDCRFCHTSVATSSYAGMPDTQTCMTCHSQVWKDAPMLAPVRASYEENKPLKWNRIYEMPGFVYFNHSIHVNKGIGCSSCHGDVDQMPITWKANHMAMQFCLSCHRHPEEQIRQLGQVYNMKWSPPQNPEIGAALVKARNIDKDHLTDCSACHR
jgi:hypothetical protein